MVCDKFSYDTYKEAQAATAHIKTKNGMKTYKCNDCGKFHIATIKTNKNTFRVKEKYKADYTNIKPLKVKKQKIKSKFETIARKEPEFKPTMYRPFEYIMQNKKP